MQSEEFLTKEGLRQGGVLSPALFNIVLDDVFKEIKNKTKRLQVGHRNLQIVEISECAFADDLIVYAKNERDLQLNLNVWKTALEKRNMKINVDKTKVMVIGKNASQIKIQIEEKELEQVEAFKYLGVNIHKNGKEDLEINNRIENTTKLYYALNNTFIRKKEISEKTKITVYKTVFKPVLTYGCESWVLNQQMKSRIQALEMKYLRAAKGVTRRDRIRNQTIREDLNVEPIIESIEKQKLKWFGHMMRMGEERQTKKIWLARTANKRTRGRPKATWDNTVAKYLEKRGKTWNEATRMARNKKEWARFVHS